MRSVRHTAPKARGRATLPGVAAALVIALLATMIAACGGPTSATPNPASATPEATAEPTQTPAPAAAALGEEVAVGTLRVTLVYTAEWPPSEQGLGPDIRGVTFHLRLAASGADATLEESGVTLVNLDTEARYAPAYPPGAADTGLPLAIPAGTTVEHDVAFTVPLSGSFQLEITDATGAVAQIAAPIGAGDAPSPGPDANPTPIAAPSLIPGSLAETYNTKVNTLRATMRKIIGGWTFRQCPSGRTQAACDQWNLAEYAKLANALRLVLRADQAWLKAEQVDDCFREAWVRYSAIIGAYLKAADAVEQGDRQGYADYFTRAETAARLYPSKVGFWFSTCILQ